LFDLLFLILIK